MTTARLRRIVASVIAAAGLAALASPSAHADTLWVRTAVSVPAPYDTGKLLTDGTTVLERGGPVMLKVRHTITCQWVARVRRPGQPKTCQWSSALYGSGSATVGSASGQGDVYALGTSTYPTLGTTFHAGTLRVGQTATDEWTLIVRDDQVREAMETFRMSVNPSSGPGYLKQFVIADDD